MKNQFLPWWDKYSLKDIDKSLIHKKEIAILKKFIASYAHSKTKIAILHGPTGIGKTNLIHALAKSLDLEILETNASEYRNKNAIGSMFGVAVNQQSLFSRGKLILIDEIDALSGTKDRGAIAEVLKIASKSSFPVIATAIDPYDSKLSTLRKKSLMVELKNIETDGFVSILKNICDSENVEYDDIGLKLLAKKSETDLRAAINDLQILTSDDKLDIAKMDTLSDRNKTISMQKVLKLIFKSNSYSVLEKAYSEANEDFDQVFLWLDENIPKEYTDVESLEGAYDYMSKADVMKGRIRRRQYWRFLVYINAFLGPGVGLSKKQVNNKFVSYRPTSRILKKWMANRKYAKRTAIAEKLGELTHISKKDAVKEFKYFKTIFSKKGANRDNIISDFDLDSDEIAYLDK